MYIANVIHTRLLVEKLLKERSCLQIFLYIALQKGEQTGTNNGIFFIIPWQLINDIILGY